MTSENKSVQTPGAGKAIFTTITTPTIAFAFIAAVFLAVHLSYVAMRDATGEAGSCPIRSLPGDAATIISIVLIMYVFFTLNPNPIINFTPW